MRLWMGSKPTTSTKNEVLPLWQRFDWQSFSLCAAVGFKTAIQKQRCDLISSPLNRRALLIEPLSPRKRELFQVFPLDVVSLLSKAKTVCQIQTCCNSVQLLTALSSFIASPQPFFSQISIKNPLSHQKFEKNLWPLTSKSSSKPLTDPVSILSDNFSCLRCYLKQNHLSSAYREFYSPPELQ